MSSPGAIGISGPYRLLDIGRGGFAIESSTPFAPGDEHLFEFNPTCECSVTLHARAVHTTRAIDAEGAVWFVTGFALSRLGSDMPIRDLLLAILDLEDATSEPLDYRVDSLVTPDVEDLVMVHPPSSWTVH